MHTMIQVSDLQSNDLIFTRCPFKNARLFIYVLRSAFLFFGTSTPHKHYITWPINIKSSWRVKTDFPQKFFFKKKNSGKAQISPFQKISLLLKSTIKWGRMLGTIHVHPTPTLLHSVDTCNVVRVQIWSIYQIW